MLPSRYLDSSDPWEWLRESVGMGEGIRSVGFTNKPPSIQDEQILLVLNYPKKFSLTNRAIRGSMKSLNPKSNLKYFDEVHISSWLGASASYEFGSKNIVCSPSYEDSSMGNDVELYKGLDLCSILQRIAQGEGSSTIVPKKINSTNGGFKEVKLVLQDVRCKRETSKDSHFTKVSSVFRAVDPLEYSHSSMRRTGLNNMTLSVEGEWNHTSGKLCMVGCIGLESECNSRIVLYMTLLFSIKQRSMIKGTISSIQKSNSWCFPPSFEMLVRNAELWNPYTAARPYYKYTKIDQSILVSEKYRPFSVGKVIKKSFLEYPKVEKADGFSGLSYLAEDLTLHTAAYKAYVQLEIISLDSLFSPYWSSQNSTTNFDEKTQYETRSEYTEKELLLNVSAQLTFWRNPDSHPTTFFVEGLYDEHVGNMYLIGCRDVRASWEVLHDSMDLENGLDCLVEGVITYPPTTARWLVHPTAIISLSSQRNEDDPLYFMPIKLETFPLMYRRRRQREGILSRRGIEGILRIMTLSVTIACILSQFFNIRDNLESVPFISLVMLGVQTIGYSLPLITGADMIFKKLGSDNYDNQSCNLARSQWIQVIDYLVKILVLASFLITVRIFQKVWKSRTRLLTRAPLEPHRVPSDKMVLIITSVLHIIGYIIVLFIHFARTSQTPKMLRGTQTFVDSHRNSQWETELEEYIGLVQDFFLLPQIIGNFLWQIDTKPLRKLYFLGLTTVRVLPRIYDFVKSPVTIPYFSEEYEFVNPRYDFYSRFGGVAIPVMGILLAVIVYAQQRWKYDKLRETISIGNRKLLPLGSKAYERLPSQSFEDELVTSVKDNVTHKKLR